MSLSTANGISEQLIGLKQVHAELESSIDESIQPVWQLNDGLLTWVSLLSKDDEDYIETANHFMAVSVWLERMLFSNRNKPLCSKGVFRELTLLEEAIEDRAHEYVRGDIASQQVVLSASLSVLLLAPGPDNAALVSFADKVERLLEQDLTPLYIELVFPDRLVPSLSAVLAYVQTQIVECGENSAPEAPAEPVDPFDEEFTLPELDDF